MGGWPSAFARSRVSLAVVIDRCGQWTSPAFEDTVIYPGFRGVGGLESGGDLLLLVLVLVFGRGEHVQGAVAPSAVVPDLDVVVDRAGELDTGLPSFAVQQLDLHSGPERLDHRIIERGADSTDRRRAASTCDQKGCWLLCCQLSGGFIVAITSASVVPTHGRRLSHHVRRAPPRGRAHQHFGTAGSTNGVPLRLPDVCPLL